MEEGSRGLATLARGGTDRWKRLWLVERAFAEWVLHKPARFCVHVTGAAVIGMLLANFFLVTLRFTQWAGSYSGLTYEVTELLLNACREFQTHPVCEIYDLSMINNSATPSRCSARRPLTTTSAPNSANSSAMLRPIPVPPPVTTATRSSNENVEIPM